MKDNLYYLLLRAIVYFAVRNFGIETMVKQQAIVYYRVLRGYVWGKVVSFQIKVNFFENGTLFIVLQWENVTGLIW